MTSPSSSALLAEWPEYSFWEDETSYTTDLHVNPGHPTASDRNPGTEQEPLVTIQAASDRAKPATRILIHEGTYRECIRPAAGGTSSSHMIRYQAVPGEHVEIKGSIQLVVFGVSLSPPIFNS